MFACSIGQKSSLAIERRYRFAVYFSAGMPTVTGSLVGLLPAPATPAGPALRVGPAGCSRRAAQCVPNSPLTAGPLQPQRLGARVHLHLALGRSAENAAAATDAEARTRLTPSAPGPRRSPPDKPSGSQRSLPLRLRSAAELR